MSELKSHLSNISSRNSSSLVDSEHKKEDVSDRSTLASSVADLKVEKDVKTGEDEQANTSSTSSTSTSTTSSDEEEEEELEEVEQAKVPIKNPLDDLSDEELTKVVNDLKTEMRHLKTENNMFEQYLNLNDPQVLEGMTLVIENAIKIQGGESLRRGTLTDDFSIKSIGSGTKLDSLLLGILLEKGPRINLTQKSDMVIKEMDEVQKNLNKFYKDAHKRKCNLRAELEEVGIELAEFTEALSQFEEIVVVEGIDPLTQRIPAEKFIRFVQEWLKISAATIQKFRLRQSTLSSHLKKLKETLKQKKELGESLHAVDFEKLQIENNHFLKEIDLRTIQLVDLKRMSGGANLILTNQKKFLMKQIIEMQNIQRDIDETKDKIEELERETEKTEEQLDRVKLHYDNIKQMIEEYKVPDVMEYVRIKGKLYELQKNIKIWSRRSHLQNVALNSSIREMKNITGSKKVLDTWFEINYPHTSTSDLDVSAIQKKSEESINVDDMEKELEF